MTTRPRPAPVVVAAATPADLGDARAMTSGVLGGYQWRWHADRDDLAATSLDRRGHVLSVARDEHEVLGAAAIRPCDLADAAHLLVGRVLRLHAALRAMPRLAPSPVVDALFGELVGTCLTGDARLAPAVLADPRLAAVAGDLVALCAQGETELERHWASVVLAAADPAAALAGFPYLGNYDDLMRLELGALAGAGRPVDGATRVGVVGCGPLPLTALALHRATGAHVVAVDNDPDACATARAVLDRLAPAGAAVRRADALTGDGLAEALEGCGVVVLAALVGLGPRDKTAVLATLARALRPGTRVVLRSADGLRSLLYPVVDVADVVAAGLVPELVAHPMGTVVNSALVARRGG